MTDHNGKPCIGCGKRFCSNPTHLCERDFLLAKIANKDNTINSSGGLKPILVSAIPSRSDEWGELRNQTARLGLKLVQLREELPRVEKEAKRTPPNNPRDERFIRTQTAKKRLPILQAELLYVATQHKELQADIDALTEFTSKLLVSRSSNLKSKTENDLIIIRGWFNDLINSPR